MSTKKLKAVQADTTSHAHEVFMNAVIHGATPTNAYMQAFPGTSRVAAYSSSSRLMKKPEIWQHICDAQMAIERERYMQERQDIVDQIARIDSRLMTLADIIDGRWQRRDTTINKDTGGVIERYRSDPKAAIQAIKLELKLTDLRTQLQERLTAHDHERLNTSESEEIKTLTNDELEERMAYADGRPWPRDLEKVKETKENATQTPPLGGRGANGKNTKTLARLSKRHQ